MVDVRIKFGRNGQTVKKTEAGVSRFFVGAGNTIALLIDEGLFHLLAGEGVGLVTAEDEDLTVTEEFGIILL